MPEATVLSMGVPPRLLLGATMLALTACSPPDREAAGPLPTRQTTIDPVKKKLEAATKDIELRRQDSNDVTK